MFNQIIKFVENDIDGCGASAEVTVLVKTDVLLTDEHQKLFEKTIEDIKNEWKDDGWDTDSIVNETLNRVFGSDADVEAIIPDLVIEF